MFSSMKLYATVLAFSAAAKAISSLQVPTSPSSGGSITLTWSSDDSDTVPVTVALFSTNPSYNGPFAIANNVNPKDNKATIPLPDVVPGPGYTVALISMSDTSKVFASSTTFSIAPPAPVVSTKPTASSTGASSVKHTSGSATGSHSASANATHSGSVSATHSGSVSVTHSGSVNATHSGSVSATHSGSVSATHSGSVVSVHAFPLRSTLIFLFRLGPPRPPRSRH
ncbi:hypothetical protein DFH09DRAFT_626107 [Mycena vulgaris]|nr:hypothetical protein DFH09DRAFT_626107 [Mycena vulgaris]